MSARRLIRPIAALGAVLGGWFGIMLTLPFVGPEGRLVAVVGDPRSTVPTVVSAGGRVVAVGDRFALARSDRSDDRSDFAGRLYAAGARLVIEGRVAAGCLSLS